jgi:translation initiation factor IF-2
MAKKRVDDLIKSIGLELDKDEIVRKINDLDLGFTVKSDGTSVTEEQAAQLLKALSAEAAVVKERVAPTVIRRRGRQTPDAADADTSAQDAAAPTKRATVTKRPAAPVASAPDPIAKLEPAKAATPKASPAKPEPAAKPEPVAKPEPSGVKIRTPSRARAAEASEPTPAAEPTPPPAEPPPPATSSAPVKQGIPIKQRLKSDSPSDQPEPPPPPAPVVASSEPDATFQVRPRSGIAIRKSAPVAAPAAAPPRAPEPAPAPAVAAAPPPPPEPAPVALASVSDADDNRHPSVIIRRRRDDDPVSPSLASDGDKSRVGIKGRPASPSNQPQQPLAAASALPPEEDAAAAPAPTSSQGRVGAISIMRGAQREAIEKQRVVTPAPASAKPAAGAPSTKKEVPLKKGVRPAKGAPVAPQVEEEEDFDERSGRGKSRAPNNVAGYIDPNVIQERLAKDNKSFVAKPAKPATTGRRPVTPTIEEDEEVTVAIDPRAARRVGVATLATPAAANTTGRKVINRPDLYSAAAARSASGARSMPSGGGGGRRGPRGAKGRKGPGERTQITQTAEHKRLLRIDGVISVNELAHEMGVKSSEIIKLLMGMGMMVTINQTIDAETASIAAQEFGFSIEDIGFKAETYLARTSDAPEDLILRAPVVTVMGHVDHGKTSLLDAIRNTNVTATEAGGITQHIGAHFVDTANGGRVVFLDTPGHEAFTALRARGAKVTDIVVLVVAADDGVMPQTIEAINHARAAAVPIIVAINKIDKPGANPERIKQSLTEFGLVPEEWGGSNIFVEVSALMRTNIDGLLEMILLQSEVLELRANPSKPARGVVLEAYKDPKRGIVANLLVQEGTLRPSDIVVSGSSFGRVRAIRDSRGADVLLAAPSTAVEIIGLADLPDAGEPFFVAADDKLAREFTDHASTAQRVADLHQRRVDPWAALKETKTLNLIIKSDVQGSLEALTQSVNKLSTSEIKVNVIHAAVGGITESDVQLAVASSAQIIGFNVRPESRATDLAKREGVTFELHSIIYEVIDRVRLAMTGLLDPVFEESALGRVEVRNIFRVPKVGTVAGCFVLDGRVTRSARARVLRDNRIIYDNSRINSLRRVKDDVKEVKAGFECGLSLVNFNDIKINDIIEVYEIKEVAATL